MARVRHGSPTSLTLAFQWSPVAGCVNCVHLTLGSIEGFLCEPVHRCKQAFQQLWTLQLERCSGATGLTRFSSPEAAARAGSPSGAARAGSASVAHWACSGWDACGLAVVPSMECRSWAQVPEVTFQEALLISSIWKTHWMAGSCPETQGVRAAVCRCHQ